LRLNIDKQNTTHVPSLHCLADKRSSEQTFFLRK
jgi:hypothetical protein